MRLLRIAAHAQDLCGMQLACCLNSCTVFATNGAGVQKDAAPTNKAREPTRAMVAIDLLHDKVVALEAENAKLRQDRDGLVTLMKARGAKDAASIQEYKAKHAAVYGKYRQLKASKDEVRAAALPLQRLHKDACDSDMLHVIIGHHVIQSDAACTMNGMWSDAPIFQHTTARRVWQWCDAMV